MSTTDVLSRALSLINEVEGTLRTIGGNDGDDPATEQADMLLEANKLISTLVAKRPRALVEVSGGVATGVHEEYCTVYVWDHNGAAAHPDLWEAVYETLPPSFQEIIRPA